MAAAAAALPVVERGKVEPDDIVGEVDEELVCSLCACVLKAPHSCQAGHTFCMECIAEWFRRSQTCPVDREPLGSLETLTRQRPMENMISRLTVRCPYRGRRLENGRPPKRRRASRPDEQPSEPQVAYEHGAGCDWTGRLSDRDTHLANDCDFALKLCEHEGCGERVPLAEFAAHAAACMWRVVVCRHCGTRREAFIIDTHEGRCQEMPVDCPYKNCGCDEMPLRKHLDQHLKESRREHAELTGQQMKRMSEQMKHIATTVRHKTVWTVDNIAAKARADDMVDSPVITLDVGRNVQLNLRICFTEEDDGQQSIDISVFLNDERDQASLLPLEFRGTKITVEASSHHGKVLEHQCIDDDDKYPGWSRMQDMYDGIYCSDTVKVQEFVGDKIVIIVDWMIERKATHISTT